MMRLEHRNEVFRYHAEDRMLAELEAECARLRELVETGAGALCSRRRDRGFSGFQPRFEDIQGVLRRFEGFERPLKGVL